jgi:hypothetical protein
MISQVNCALRTINHVSFTPPANPPAVPAHAYDATVVQINEDNRAHAHQRHEFNHYQNIDKTLHNQHIVAVPAIYIVALCNPVITFGNTTTLDMWAHLHDTYGGITEAALDGNTDTMKDQWQPPILIEVLYLQIKDGIYVAFAGDNPKSEPAIL